MTANSEGLMSEQPFFQGPASTDVGLITAVPEIGQIVTVRGATWAVTDVQQQSLPRSAHDDAVRQLQNAVTLQSVEDDRLGDELRVVWELEPGRSLKPPQDLPTRIDASRFDPPERLAAFIDVASPRY